MVLPGCGDDEAADPTSTSGDVVDISGTEPVGQMTAGSVAPLVQCRDWTGANEDEKLATIADIRSQVNQTDTGIDAPPLSDDEAMSVFDNACSEDFAEGFRLYVLYARAAGFAPLTREEP